MTSASHAEYLKNLPAVKEVLLISAGETNIVSDACSLKVSYIDSPKPEHGEYWQQWLIVDIKQFCVSNIC